MARGSLPAQTPTVPPDVFIPLDLLYRHVQQMDGGLRALEGAQKIIDTPFVSNAVLTADTVLQRALPAQRTLRIDALLICSGNVKLRHTGPAAPSLVMLRREYLDAGSSVINLDTAFSAVDIVAANPAIIRLQGLVKAGAISGFFGISWAQTVSSVTPSRIYPGSVLQCTLVD